LKTWLFVRSDEVICQSRAQALAKQAQELETQLTDKFSAEHAEALQNLTISHETAAAERLTAALREQQEEAAAQLKVNTGVFLVSKPMHSS